MSPYNNLFAFMLAALFFGSVISHAPVHKRPHSSVAKPPSVIHVPTPSPSVLVEPALSPVEPPLVQPPSPVISPSFSPVLPPVHSPSVSMPPAEAPAPESNAALKSVSVSLVTFGAFVVALMP